MMTGLPRRIFVAASSLMAICGRQSSAADVSTSSADGEFDRSVVAGEAGGRWLWIVLRPASALLLLREDWILRDVSHLGPQLVELPFGGPRPTW